MSRDTVRWEHLMVFALLFSIAFVVPAVMFEHTAVAECTTVGYTESGAQEIIDNDPDFSEVWAEPTYERVEYQCGDMDDPIPHEEVDGLFNSLPDDVPREPHDGSLINTSAD